MDMHFLQKRPSPVTHALVTIRPVNKKIVHVSYNIHNKSGGGIVDLPLGGSSTPPQPTGYATGGPSISVPGFVTLKVTQSRNKSRINVLYESQYGITEATLAQLGQHFHGCEVKISNSRKRKTSFRK